MNIKQVSSRNNAFQHVEVVKRNRAKRTKFKEVVIEGVLPINLCIEGGIRIKSFYFAGFDTLSDWAKDIIAANPETELYSLTNSLMHELSDKEETSEIIVLAEQPTIDVDSMDLERVILLDRPSNPGNFGSIIRTCDSFGIDGIILSGHGIDPYDPKSIAASRGTVFTLPVAKLESYEQLSRFIARSRRNDSFTVFGSSARGNTSIRDVEPTPNFILIVGNETTGMSPYFHELSDTILTIPMVGHATSLNIACATSILLYQLTR